MDNNSPINPYAFDGDDGGAPFAGRQDAFGRLYGLLTDTARQHGFLFLGRKGVGKTAMLHAISGMYKDTAISVFMPLRESVIEGESAWLLALAQGVTALLIERGFTLSRLSMIEAPGADMRRWLDEVFLPHVFATIRPSRQLIFLFDDAERLLTAITAGTLPADILQFFTGLLKKYRQLQWVFTLDTEYEDELSQFGALISYQHVYRLGNLSPDEVKWLMTAPVSDYYVVPDDVVLAVVQQTGGTPSLTQRFGYEFFSRWYDSPNLNVITTEDVKIIASKIYSEVRVELRSVWDNLATNGRLVLTAISGSLYDDPIGKLSADSLQAWLVETDYPLDTTAINAALRRLEYGELVTHTAHGIALTSELMKTWLLENARTINRAALPIPGRMSSASPAVSVESLRRVAGNPRLIRLLLLALALLIIANLIALALVNNTPIIVVTGTPPPPTVTLAQP